MRPGSTSASLPADALRDIEALHITLLDDMAQSVRRRTPVCGTWRTWRTKLPRLAEGMGPLLAVLQRTGCILSGAGFGGGVHFRVNKFGRELLGVRQARR